MKVYADNAATTAVSREVLDAMLPFFIQTYGNPSSIHDAGQSAARAIEESRERMAFHLNTQAKEIYFTSGGTEANNWAVTIAAGNGKRQSKKHLVSTVIEHHAILHTLETYEKQGYEVTLLPVHSDGIVRPEELANAIRDDTALVTVMYVNNEIGTIQPIEKIGRICRERDVLFHTDAIQAAGQLPLDVQEQNIDMLSLSAHKFHGPKGVGALYCRSGLVIPPLLQGGGQERGKRAGTENVPAIVGMAKAFGIAVKNREATNQALMKLRDQLIVSLAKIDGVHVNGHMNNRVPGIISLCIEGIEGESMLLMLNAAGIYASSGSACTSGSLDPSHVLLALGLPHEIAHSSLRLSLSAHNTQEEMDYINQTLPPIVERLRDMSPLWSKREESA